MKVVSYSQFWNPFWIVPEERLQQLREEFPAVEFVNAKTEQELGELLPEADIFFGYRLNLDDLNLASKLKWIHVPAANVHPIVTLPLKERGILLTNSSGLHAVPIAEHVIGVMLVFSRRFMECFNFQQQSHYGQRELLSTQPPLRELRGKTISILGLGKIGKETARLSKVFGMRVLAAKRTVAGNYHNVDHVYSHRDFREILPPADYLVVCTPRTPETEEMLGEKELSLLKPECVLINVARASVVDQKAMLRALKENRIRGAALDVYEREPLPPDSELWSLPNVFLTPHVSGVSSEEHWPRIFELFRSNLIAFLSGFPLQNIVEFGRGY